MTLTSFSFAKNYIAYGDSMSNLQLKVKKKIGPLGVIRRKFFHGCVVRRRKQNNIHGVWFDKKGCSSSRDI